MIQSDWFYGLLGGLMIGTAAALFLLLRGRIMGASGILGGLLSAKRDRTALENLAFVGGVILMPALIALLATVPETQITTEVLWLVLGGLFVGFGTRLANGCTSGHGVCGISRFAPRGIGATTIYLGAGFVTMAVLRHGLGVL